MANMCDVKRVNIYRLAVDIDRKALTFAETASIL